MAYRHFNKTVIDTVPNYVAIWTAKEREIVSKSIESMLKK